MLCKLVDELTFFESIALNIYWVVGRVYSKSILFLVTVYV